MFSSFELELEELEELITQEYSIDPDVLGTHAYLEGKDDRGGDAFVLGGFQRAPEHLAVSLDVRLESPVASVSAGKRGLVVLETDGTSHRADIPSFLITFRFSEKYKLGICIFSL